MRPRRLWEGAIIVLAAGLLTACGGPEDEEAPATAAVDAAAATEADQRAQEQAAIPPKPDEDTAAAYIAALKAINPEITKDREPERLVDRGRDQCATIKTFPNEPEKVVMYTNMRFTSPGHPDGFGKATAKQINAVIVEHLCPDLA
ncbi:hypothetical protein AMIS_44820 [Actinoplanes missouriensis 431]|uniref:DUF732 domain-containing protein n=1 Tax=Actinoplanes missouriensis (strain ATCC 14538 / DSM 43046 / CBS 188.64 / JCM 3121 / NBRC 102363 / NCIMB 12654 / NRRL B-3342 / UNCC 431) TaxID=512565 RepID=I0H9L5_ACTM4|nr:hypothetical protein [Actinoplanes missouriensis]BAL89702.1 hypothetical protein AMIS_44820 [Actinoplanes missouriensis 431]